MVNHVRKYTLEYERKTVEKREDRREEKNENNYEPTENKRVDEKDGKEHKSKWTVQNKKCHSTNKVRTHTGYKMLHSRQRT